MADRPGKTRQKTTFRVTAPKPRNPLVAPAFKRVAGPHRKPIGAARAAARDALRKKPHTDEAD